MYFIKQFISQKKSSLPIYLKPFIAISLITCLLSILLGSIMTAQTPVSPTTPIENTTKPPQPSPSLNPILQKESVSPSPKVESPSPKVEEATSEKEISSPQPKNSSSNIDTYNAEIQRLVEVLNVTPEEAKKILEKRNELDDLGIFDLQSGELGNLKYRAIKLDGQIIFPIADDIEANETDLESRSKKIENTLNEIVRRNIPPNQIRAFPSILNNQTVIIISRLNQASLINPEHQQRWILMTVTDADSRLYGIPIPVLSRILSKLIDEALDKAWEVRQPASLIAKGIISLGVLIGMIIASWILIFLQKYLVPKVKRKSILWNRKILQVGHAIIWFPGIGLILKEFPDSYEIGVWLLDNTLTISTAIISFLIIGRILDLIIRVGESHEKLKGVPIRVFVQLFYILVAILFVLIIVANWINQPLTSILAAVGAGSAILMIIFKDSIMGFTAGIQLATNRMVALGDWIEMPNYGANGFVNEVNLFTVKVLNWDNTITLIPTYALISDSFKNWRAMFESGGRQIQRSVYIDMSSIKFCDAEMLERFSKIKYISDYIQERQAELFERTHYSQDIDNTILAKEKLVTNIGIFRAYVTAYLQAHPKISPGPYFLVRQLQPTAHGLPIEVYVYCNDTAWAHYENIQTDIFEHILSVVPTFDLRVFQRPSGYDLKRFMLEQHIELEDQ